MDKLFDIANLLSEGGQGRNWRWTRKRIFGQVSFRSVSGRLPAAVMADAWLSFILSVSEACLGSFGRIPEAGGVFREGDNRSSSSRTGQFLADVDVEVEFRPAGLTLSSSSMGLTTTSEAFKFKSLFFLRNSSRRRLPYCYYYLRVLYFANICDLQKIAKLSTRKNFYQHIRHVYIKAETGFHFGTCIAILFDRFCLFFSSFPCHHELEKVTFHDEINDRGSLVVTG